MKLICIIPLNDLLHHPYPDALINERLRDAQFDLDKMILQGVTWDGQKAWFGQERFGHGRTK